MKGFIEFVREQGVVGLAVGFILGGAVSKVVSSLVESVINPLLSVALGSVENLGELQFMLRGIPVSYGLFLEALVDFVVIALVVYFGIKGLGLDKLDKKKS